MGAAGRGSGPGRKTSARNRGNRWRRRLARGVWSPDDKMKREAAERMGWRGQAEGGKKAV